MNKINIKLLLFSVALLMGTTAYSMTKAPEIQAPISEKQLPVKWKTKTISNLSDHISELKTSDKKLSLENITYVSEGKSLTVTDTLTDTATLGLLVLKQDQVLHEEYFGNSTQKTLFPSYPINKSITSAMVGIALHDGTIRSIDDSVAQYAPVLASSSYKDVSLRHLLQMSSGIKFNEGYGFDADYKWMITYLGWPPNTLDGYIAGRGHIENFVPGTYWHYIGMDPAALATVLRGATGMSMSDYMQEKLWTPAGMESIATLETDRHGLEMGFCCTNMTLRDFARFGKIYANQGKIGGVQIVPAAWVKESTTPTDYRCGKYEDKAITPDEPCLTAEGGRANPAQDKSADSPNTIIGYGYMWWVPKDGKEDFIAVGLKGQFIYVDPKKNLVIAKVSNDLNLDKKGYTDQMLAMFRAIGEKVE